MSEFNRPRVGVCTSRAAVGKTSPSFRKGRVRGLSVADGGSVSQSESICEIDRNAKVSGE